MNPPPDIEAFFGPGGLLSRSLPGWEHRPEQQRMALAVARAIAQNDVCLVEAGTGVGKTLGYLVPAILSGRKTVVATGTRTLMAQVMEKEIPFLREVLGIPFTSALLKGRSNYLCLQRLETAQDHPDLFQGIEASLRRRIRAWAATTETGDFVEWTDEPESQGA
ncbi:DEAD/DEAH box helicase, partial [Myxococcota bacterium]|nr:DEAD/DEAH box helicase [Myxococcota bacterium]